MTDKLTLSEFHDQHVRVNLPPQPERHIDDDADAAHALSELLREKGRYDNSRMFEVVGNAGPAQAAAALLSHIGRFSCSVEQEIIRRGAEYLASLRV